MSMLEDLKKLEAEGKVGGSDFFKPQNGNNIFRVVSEGVYDVNKFGNARFLMFIIDRKDSKVKPFSAPYTVYKAIASLEEDPFYKFQGMPMPYDINLKAEKAGSKDVEYNVQASPNKTPLAPEEIVAVKEKGPIGDYVKRLREQASASGVSTAPAGAVTPEEAAQYM